jgi:alkylhydroperoxidase/carboxymuconolactone decarboxylase family protein YurZ
MEKKQTETQSPHGRRGSVAYLGSAAGQPGAAFKGFVDAIYADPHLDPKTRELVFVGVLTAQNFEAGIRAHVPRALAAGASRDEIVATMMISVVNGGAGGALRFVPIVDELVAGA